ncbi:MAG: hypothetical protein K6L75_02715 [Cellvibrionaceae bacterium]
MKYRAEFKNEKEVASFFSYFLKQLPSRADGRTTFHVESAMFAQFILNSLGAGLWSYPATVVYDDKPDFEIYSSKGSIGVEITEQKNKNYGHALSLLENSDGFLEKSDFEYSDSESKIKGRELARLVSKKEITGPPSMGLKEERNWVIRTVSTVLEKWKKYINYPRYKEYDLNILVIFDVRPESPIFDDLTDEMKNELFSLGNKTEFSQIICIDSKYVTIDLMNRNFVVENC